MENGNDHHLHPLKAVSSPSYPSSPSSSSPSSPLSPSSLKQKIKHSFCLPSPFRKHHSPHVALNGNSSSSTPPAASEKATPTRSSTPPAASERATLTRTSSSSIPTAWIKSRAHEIPELTGKCRNLISRIGRNNGHGHGQGQGHGHGHGHGHGKGHHGHRRRHSIAADLRYDPSSYALNFDEGGEDGLTDEYPLRSFSSRLPRSPTAGIECLQVGC